MHKTVFKFCRHTTDAKRKKSCFLYGAGILTCGIKVIIYILFYIEICRPVCYNNPDMVCIREICVQYGKGVQIEKKKT